MASLVTMSFFTEFFTDGTRLLDLNLQQLARVELFQPEYEPRFSEEVRVGPPTPIR